MKASKIISGSFLFLTLTASGTSAQEFTLTTTSANVISSKASIDRPGLSGNPLAIIVATPLGDTENLNPHPLGAWYYSGKWNIFNSDHAVMPTGLKYKIQYFPTPSPDQFLHVITPHNLGSEGSYIDHPALNNNPNAQFQILQNHAPDNRSGYYLNKFEAKAAYSSAAGKWYVANVNGKPLYPNTAYNVVISAGGARGSNISSTSPALSPTATAATNPTPTPTLTTGPAPTSLISPARLPTPGRVQFNNLSFDLGTFWAVAERSDVLVLKPTTEIISDHVRVRVGPAMSATANIQSQLDGLWAPLVAGKEMAGSIIADSGDFLGPEMRQHRRFVKFKSGGSAGIYLIEAGGKITPFVFTSDNSMGTGIAPPQFTFGLLMSARVEVEGGRPTDPASGGVDVGFAPSDQGADAYDSIDWDGPDQFTDGVYDIHPVNPKAELQELTLLGQPFIGSVRPKAMSFDEALAHVRLLLNDPKTKSDYEDLKKKLGSADPFTLQGAAFAGVVSGRPFDALVALFAAYELYPDDPDNLLNLAGIFAHVGMPNESMAVLTEMERRGMKPSPPAGIDPDAAMEYLKGFNQLLTGQTLAAKGHLRRAINRDRFLKEASIALAVAQKLTGEEEEAEKTYYYGVWRRMPAHILLCGGTRAKAEGQTIRPPITDMLDISHGTPGVLPQFPHPKNFAQVIGFKESFDRKAAAWIAERNADGRKITELILKLAARPKTSSEARAAYLDFLMSTLGDEPDIKKLRDAEDKAFQELKEATGRIARQNLRKAQALALSGARGEVLQRELENISNQGVATMRLFAQAYDTALRRQHRTWHRYATGVATHLGDPDWHEKAVLIIRNETESKWILLHTVILEAYAACIVTANRREQAADAENPERSEVAQCPAALRGTGFKVTLESPAPVGPDIKVGIKITCEKTTLEAAFHPWKVKSNPAFEAGVGPFVQLELPNGGGRHHCICRRQRKSGRLRRGRVR